MSSIPESAFSEVKRRLELAKRDRNVPMNLWFKPNQEAFRQLTRQVFLGDLDLELYEYDGHIYRTTYDSHNSDTGIWCLGQITRHDIRFIKKGEPNDTPEAQDPARHQPEATG